MHKLLIVVAVVVLSIVVGVAWYFSATEVVSKTKVIAWKEIETETDIIIIPEDSSVGIPINSRKFIFIMEDGSEVEVSKKDFVTYNVGDLYTYTVRQWK